jgi:DNA-binding MarR family transcriptional regulator
LTAAQAEERSATAQVRVAYLIGRLDRALWHRIAEAVAPFGLTVRQYTALSVLNALGPLSNAHLAKRSFMTPQAANEMVKAMEALKLVIRRAALGQGRILPIRLTPLGARLLRQCDRRVESIETAMLKGIARSEQLGLERNLRRCLATLDPFAGRS